MQLIGYNDEILDIALVGSDNSHVAVATNSEQARVFNRHSLNCQLLSGHSGMYWLQQYNNFDIVKWIWLT